MIQEFQISTRAEESIVNITEQVERIVAEGKVKEGICVVYVPHATAAIVINEGADSNVGNDLLTALNKMVEKHGGWLHDTIDNNAHAHIKASLLGPSETVIIKNGKLQLGTWQSIFLCDFDGPRERKVIVKVLEG
ncbi:YjbQ family protein [Candidatus Woesearchaeota archaeon]|nr:YjbQ family protein [Candidatus Woesearchaeota archaeon]